MEHARPALGAILLAALPMIAFPASARAAGPAEAEAAAAVEATLDTAASHYFFAPSALNPARGHGYVAQTELAVTQVAFGITDHVELEAATSIPMLLANLSPNFAGGAAGLLGAKAGAPLGRRLHGALGVKAFGLLDDSGGSGLFMPYGCVTFGDARHNISLNGGVVIDGDGDVSVPLALSGAILVSDTVGVMSETWLLFDGPGEGVRNLLFASSLGARFLPRGGGWNIDAGLVLLGIDGDLVSIPLPWLSAGWHFGS
ncbi:MAG: hypothetical protein ABIO70_19755 [Pseudomonadota bacterium]